MNTTLRAEILSLISNRANALANTKAEIEREEQEIGDLLSRLQDTPAEPEKKGYAPPTLSASVSAGYGQMTIRNACRSWYVRHGNKPMSPRDLSDQTGKNRGSTAAILSAYPEFVKLGDGTWQMHPNYYQTGHVTVGR